MIAAIRSSVHELRVAQNPAYRPVRHLLFVFNDLASGKTHGFLRTNNEYATIDFPGANVTAARGINREGDIVGFYVDASGKTHGFLRRGDDE